MIRPRIGPAMLFGIALLVVCLLPACANDAARAPTAPVFEIDALQPQDASGLPCETHCDCLQGEFCYQGECLQDPAFGVYCCTNPGCPPGQWCVQPDGTKGTCSEDPSYVCETACDCGPAHACLDVPDIGLTCVKDETDPWKSGASIYDVTVPDGEATYCAIDPTCFQAAVVYDGYTGGTFAAYDPFDEIVRDTCGGPACMYAADCADGQACIDTRTGAAHLPHVSCHPAGGFCVSHALAEAHYGFLPQELLLACDAASERGAPCEAGWREGGMYAVQAVLGTALSCGDTACDPWESPITCPDDCACGDGTCSSTEFTERSCPSDCGTCGDGVCTPPETHKLCRSDCPDVIGDGCCTLRDVALGHYDDCPCDDSVIYADDPSICGDGLCQRDGRIPEHFGNCPADCLNTTVELEAVVLADQIALLHDDDVLNLGHNRALQRKVTQIVDLFDRDKPEEALDVLDGFETQVRDLTGVHLTDLQAAPLLGIAGGIEQLIGMEALPGAE